MFNGEAYESRRRRQLLQTTGRRVTEVANWVKIILLKNALKFFFQFEMFPRTALKYLLVAALTMLTAWSQYHKTVYFGNLLPFHGNPVILFYKAILPWKLQ